MNRLLLLFITFMSVNSYAQIQCPKGSILTEFKDTVVILDLSGGEVDGENVLDRRKLANVDSIGCYFRNSFGDKKPIGTIHYKDRKNHYSYKVKYSDHGEIRFFQMTDTDLNIVINELSFGAWRYYHGKYIKHGLHGQYKNGIKVGKWVRKDSRGKIYSEKNYNELGQLHGKQFYLENDGTYEVSHYKNDTHDGLHEKYEDNVLTEKIIYKDGEVLAMYRPGQYMLWCEDGGVISTELDKNGKITDILTDYRELHNRSEVADEMLYETARHQSIIVEKIDQVEFDLFSSAFTGKDYNFIDCAKLQKIKKENTLKLPERIAQFELELNEEELKKNIISLSDAIPKKCSELSIKLGQQADYFDGLIRANEKKISDYSSGFGPDVLYTFWYSDEIKNLKDENIKLEALKKKAGEQQIIATVTLDRSLDNYKRCSHSKYSTSVADSVRNIKENFDSKISNIQSILTDELKYPVTKNK